MDNLSRLIGKGSRRNLFIAHRLFASLPRGQDLASCDLQRTNHLRVVAQGMNDLRNAVLFGFGQRQANIFGQNDPLKVAAKCLRRQKLLDPHYGGNPGITDVKTV